MKKLPYLIGITTGVLIVGFLNNDFEGAFRIGYLLSAGLYTPEAIEFIKRLFRRKTKVEIENKIDLDFSMPDGKAYDFRAYTQEEIDKMFKLTVSSEPKEAEKGVLTLEIKLVK